jgi:uncharacterized protein YegJ (DUF2314 family)
MIKYYLLISTLMFILSCNTNQKVKHVTKSEDEIYSTSSEDEEMNEAIDSAKSTLQLFENAFRSKKYDESSFVLKVRFDTPKGFEHIWVNNIEMEKNNYYGTINNIPESTTEVKEGEKITIDKTNITDWLYNDNGTLRGGYTIKVIRNRMTKEEREQFDKEFQLKVDD